MRKGAARVPTKDQATAAGDIFTVDDYVAPYFHVTPSEDDVEDYYLRSADVEPLDARPAVVLRRTPLYRSMAVNRQVIVNLEENSRVDVLGKVPDLQACLVHTSSKVYGWVECSALNLTFERKACYRLTNNLDFVEIRVQSGMTLTALASDTDQSVDVVRAACKTMGDNLLAGSKCRFNLPYYPPRLYVVRTGDTLTSISDNVSKLSPASLQRWNCLSSAVLQPGQRLLVLSYSY